MFGEELRSGTEAFRKFKEAIENAKAKWHAEHPDDTADKISAVQVKQDPAEEAAHLNFETKRELLAAKKQLLEMAQEKAELEAELDTADQEIRRLKGVRDYPLEPAAQAQYGEKLADETAAILATLI